MDDLELVEAADKAGLQVRVGDRAPLPRRVLAPVGQRRRARLPGPLDRADPPRLGHLQPAAPGEPPGQGGRAGGHARPPVATAASSSAPAGGRAATRSSAFSPACGDLSGTREIWEDVDRASSPRCGCRTPTRAIEGKFWSLPPRKILPKPWKQAPPGHVVRGRQHRRATRWRPARASACSASRSASLDELEPVLEAYKDDDRQRRAGRRLRQRQHHGDHRRPTSPRTSDEARKPACQPDAAYLGEQRLPLPRHLPAPRRDPVLAGAGPRPDAERDPRLRHRARASIVRRPRPRPRAVPAVGGGRRRPAGLRHRDWPAERDRSR